MKRWEILLAVLGIALLLGGSVAIRKEEFSLQDFVLDAGDCHTPMTIVEPASGRAFGSAVVLHGLSANRRLMLNFSEHLAGLGIRAYVPDLPGHGDSTDAFSFARVQHCATEAVDSLTRNGKIDPRTTILVGHSMGAAIAIRMADQEPVAATIAISPAPMTLWPQRMPSNLLVFSAQYDLGFLKQAAKKLLLFADGVRTSPEDFTQDRAFELLYVPHATHTSLLLDSGVIEPSEKWIVESLSHSLSSQAVVEWVKFQGSVKYSRAGRILMGASAGLLGLFLMFPLCATMASKFAEPAQAEVEAMRPTHPLVLIGGALCALLAMLVLAFGMPLRFLHMYSGDYLASLLLIFGIVVLVLNRNAARDNFSWSVRRIVVSLILGFATILAIGGWLNWQITDAWLSPSRWLRFAALLPAMFIFAFAEEVVLGPVYGAKRRALRFAVFLLLRGEIWIVCVLAYYELASGQVMMLILVTFLAVFSIMQRLATDALRRRISCATGAAIFGAILSCWFIATVFPLT
jgi:pimeloyl-ACP methyl ester carboxylesterase